MGYSVHAASDKDDPKMSRMPDKIVYGGAEKLEDAKALAQEAFEKKARGPNTVVYVTDDQTEERVYTAK